MKYLRPATAQEAVGLKTDHGDKAVFLAGATDLMIKLPRGFAGVLIDLTYAGIDTVERKDGKLRIGACATATSLIQDAQVGAQLPLLVLAARELGSPKIRNQATVGGNACNCSPCADMVCALTALDAEAVLLSMRGERSIPLSEFAKGPGVTHLADDELFLRVEVEPQKGAGAYHKLGLRNAQAIAVCSVGCVAQTDAGGVISHVAIACGSVAPKIARAVEAEKLLQGQALSPELLKQAADLVDRDIQPIDDLRASAHYRRVATVGMAHRALKEVLPC